MNLFVFLVGLPLYLTTVVTTGTGLTLFENAINSIFGVFASVLADLRLDFPL